ncbi:hypothetical protein PHYBOEH_010235 [Phytophthora boehmeriae]|uniref:Uncharacterized protein n=1 Tax=Phytophthora boehmeriae TaxID=109152 RepID=A0A8T1VND1_9STRA|nr:hypothetical protein PHYBOEH_010235 [Phytophthora boehmeriae]
MVAADSPHVESPEASSSSDTRHSNREPTLRVEVVGVSSSKVRTTRNERSLLLAKPEEEVYPLPWFRSPEWTNKPVPTARNPGRRRQGVEDRRVSLCPSTLLCCYGSSASDAASESDLELGYLVRRTAAVNEVDEEADSFKQCIQFLVGLIVIMAMALMLLIIFQPKPDEET